MNWYRRYLVAGQQYVIPEWASEQIEFTDRNIENAPAEYGVYALFYNGALIYFGESHADDEGGIRRRLTRHKSGDEGSCTQEATTFAFRLTDASCHEESILLEEYKGHFGYYPLCNDKPGCCPSSAD